MESLDHPKVKKVEAAEETTQKRKVIYPLNSTFIGHRTIERAYINNDLHAQAKIEIWNELSLKLRAAITRRG